MINSHIIIELVHKLKQKSENRIR